MSCRNFNFDDCFDDYLEELCDREASQRSGQTLHKSGFPLRETVAARTSEAGEADPTPSLTRRDSSKALAVFWRTALVVLVCGLLALIAIQTSSTFKQRRLASGFGHVERTAGLEILGGPLSSSSRDTYARALEMGLLSTLRVSVLGIAFASVLGLLIGFARLSKIWIVAASSRIYVGLFRNVPLLLQLLFWYALSQALPNPLHALNPMPGVFLCARGLFLPKIVSYGGLGWLILPLLVFAALAGLVLFGLRRYRKLTGAPARIVQWLAVVAIVLLYISFMSTGPETFIVRATLGASGFSGGLSVSPEFAALLIGLSTYTATFLAEIVRGAILAVDKGQAEAASALGLPRRRMLRFVVFPQALRVAFPQATAQFLNLVKNSSLAMVIGYPELTSISSATFSRTGPAIEALTLAMLVYLGISLVISLATSLYNRAIARRGFEEKFA
jgi:general L-amino acid transport system permease protein